LKGKEVKEYYTEYELGGRDQVVDGARRTMSINDDMISEVESFKYLGVQRGRSFVADIKYKIKCDRMKSREVSDIL